MNAVARPIVRRRRGPWFDLLAMLAIGVVVVGAALLPAVTANSGETTTIRGQVTVAGEALQFFPVGFWSATGTVLTRTRTDTRGRFTLDVPSTVDGYAFAGTAPDADRAIISNGGRQVVRGIIGARARPRIATPLYQGWEFATARNLAGGAEQLRFQLQEPGRLAGVSPVTGAALRGIQVRRFDGSVVQDLEVRADGRFASGQLAPGRYVVALVPAPPLLPITDEVDVRATKTAEVLLLPPQRGAAVAGVISTEEGTVTESLPVLLEQGGDVIARIRTGPGGTYRFDGLTAGDYTIEIGRFDDDEDPGVPPPGSVEVPIPGRTSLPTAQPTATPSSTPTPSPTATDESVALLPIGRTAESVLPTSVNVTVPTTLDETTFDVLAEPAGRISGVVDGADGAAVEVEVVVEEAETGRMVRRAAVDPDGAYSVGGLTRGGLYEVWAVTRPDDPTLARMGVLSVYATVSTTGADVEIDQPALTLNGTVTGAKGGTVTAGEGLLLARSAAIDASGAYVVQGLVPGLYTVVAAVDGRLVADPVGTSVTVDAAATLDLQPGPLPATYRGWFISGGAGVTLVNGTAADPEGDAIRFGPRTRAGHVTLTGLHPGDYTYIADAFAGTVPVVDGPWFFLAPTGSFSLSDGAETDVGPVVLHVRAR